MNKEYICMTEWADGDGLRYWFPVKDYIFTKILKFDNGRVYFRDTRGLNQFIFKLSESEYMEYILMCGRAPLILENLDIKDYILDIGFCEQRKSLKKTEFFDNFKDYYESLIKDGCEFITDDNL